MDSITTNLLPSEEKALECYRAFRDAGQLPPVQSSRYERAKPSAALDASIKFAMAVRDDATLDDLTERLDALHEEGMRLTGPIRAALDWMIDRDAHDDDDGYSLPELIALELPADRWIVADLIRRGVLVLLVAFVGVGKTQLGRTLVTSLARGHEWLGRRCEPCRVLHVCMPGEGTKHEMQGAYCALGGESVPDARIIFPAAVGNPGKWLRRTIGQWRPDVVLLDTLFAFINLEDTNDYAAAAQALRPLLETARELDVTIIALHHAPKMAGKGGREVLGSTKIAGSSDAILAIETEEDGEDPNGRRIIYSAKHRGGVPLNRTYLDLDADTGLVELGELVGTAKARDMDDAILDFVTSHEGAVAHKTILEEVAGRRDRKVRRLRELSKIGRLHRFGSGYRSDPMMYSVPHSHP